MGALSKLAKSWGTADMYWHPTDALGDTYERAGIGRDENEDNDSYASAFTAKLEEDAAQEGASYLNKITRKQRDEAESYKNDSALRPLINMYRANQARNMRTGKEVREWAREQKKNGWPDVKDKLDEDKRDSTGGDTSSADNSLDSVNHKTYDEESEEAEYNVDRPASERYADLTGSKHPAVDVPYTDADADSYDDSGDDGHETYSGVPGVNIPDDDVPEVYDWDESDLEDMEVTAEQMAEWDDIEESLQDTYKD